MRIMRRDELPELARPRTVWELLIEQCLEDQAVRYIAEPGVDFEPERSPFGVRVHNNARKRGVQGHTRTLGDGRVVFWFKPRR
jgi:hypothetical protein